MSARPWAFALMVGALAALWMHFRPLSADESGYHLELDLTAQANGEAWLEYDIGAGRNARDRRIFWLVESAVPRTYRVALPSGIFRSFAIIPPAGDHVVLAAGRIMAPDGVLAAAIPAVPDVADRHIIAFGPGHPLSLKDPREIGWAATALNFSMCAGVILLVCEIGRRRGLVVSARLSVGWQAATRWTTAHPRTTLLLAAALAVAASCHPVLFFGKSFVSPNNGVLCLYDQQPTVPGAPAGPVDSWNGSDINATMWAHLPYSVVAHDALLRDHELPLWNRYAMCGLTLLGQGQSMAGDPLFWGTALADGASWAWDARFLLSKCLFCFGMGLVIWRTSRHLGIAALLAVSSAFMGFFSYRFDHPAFFSLCYAPWLVLCWLGLARAADGRHAGWWAVALIGADWLELNSGTAKEASMLLLAMNAMGGLFVLLGPDTWRVRGKKLGIAAAASGLFLAISAPVWVTFLDALRQGYTIYDTPLTNQLAPGLLIGLFDDLFFRELMDNEWHVDPALNFLVLLGLCWAVLDARRIWQDHMGRAMALVSLVAAALVFAVAPPALIDRLPFLRNISHIDDVFITVLVAPLFALAGMGLRSCLERMSAPALWAANWRRTLLLLAALAALYSGTIFAVPRSPQFNLQPAHPTVLSPFFIGYALALFAAFALLPWCARRFMAARGSRAANLLIVLLCLAAMHFRHGMWLATKFDACTMIPRQRVDLQSASPAIDFVRARQAEPSRAMGFGQILRPGFNCLYRLESPAGADAVAMLALAQWYEAGGVSGMSVWWPTVTKESVGANQRLYDAMNVRYYLGADTDAAQPAPGLDKVAAADLDVYESKTAWPRAFFTDRLSRYQDVRVLAKWVREGDGRPFAAALAGENTAPATSPDQASRRIIPARNYRLTTNTTSFDIEAPSAGVVVLNESFVPKNFRVRLNGKLVPDFRVNHIFKGVALPASGTFHVEFSYWPHLLTISLVAAGIGLMIIAAAIAALWFAAAQPRNVRQEKPAGVREAERIAAR